MSQTNPIRCHWAQNALAIAYHDNEWGTPVHDDRTLFEFLVLEGAQAGLSWDTILQKRTNYRKAFNNFDPKKVAKYDTKKQSVLLKKPGIIRNKLKIKSATQNAKAFLAVQKEFGSFDKYMDQFHTSPSQLGEIASRARPKLLVLYHQLIWSSTEEDLLKEVRAGYDGKVVSAHDLDIF